MTDPILTLADLERLLDTNEAAAFDRMLGNLPVETPSPELVARVLAAAPVPRLAARWRRAAAVFVPLTAAAGLALWLTPGSPLRSRPVPLPTAVELTSLRLGEYASPTDYLLDASETAVAIAVPTFGCDDSTLGCPTLDAAAATMKDQT